LIYDILVEFYHDAAGRPVLTGTVIAHQAFGDQLKFNPHFHAIVLEGGFDEEGTFFYIPFSGLQSMVEVFRRRVIKLLVERELLNEDFARNLLSWKHSGFSIDNSVRILNESSQESLAEYIARVSFYHYRLWGSKEPGPTATSPSWRPWNSRKSDAHILLALLNYLELT